MKGFSIIVAFDEDRGIGKNGVMPWHLPADLKHFKEITTAQPGAPKNVLIMGRKTWESIPEKFRPFQHRLNVVITRKSDFLLPNGVLRVNSLQEALEVFCQGERKDVGSVFVIGGAQVFSEAIGNPLCERIYLTRIYSRFNCDCFFPAIPSSFIEDVKIRKIQENEKIFSFSVLASPKRA